MPLLQKFPQNFEFKRLIPVEKIKIADINMIFEPSQKCVTGKIEVKMRGKIKTRLLNCHKQAFKDFGSNWLLF
jgi:hypothetical protein